jgi:hypothetical protein
MSLSKLKKNGFLQLQNLLYVERLWRIALIYVQQIKENNMKFLEKCLILGMGMVMIFNMLLLIGCEAEKTAGSEGWTSSVYIDPKGCFEILIPSGWRVKEYKDDPRGKVAFIAPGDKIDLRVLVAAVDIPDYDGLLSNLKDIEKQLGISMDIEPVVFNNMPAFKRGATVTMQGITRRFIWIDLLIDGMSHNIQYGGAPNAFDKYYETAWQSMLTYKPITQEKPASQEEIRKHKAAKWIRLARIAIEMNNIKAAKDAVSAGLEIDPENDELQQLRSELKGKK